MRRTLLGAAALAVLLLLSTARPASAQGLSSLAAAMSGSSTLVGKPGCWGCGSIGGTPICMGGVVPGHWNCGSDMWQLCKLSSPGCGYGAMLPVDPDGSAQYVSRGSRLGVQVVVLAGDPSVRRNCEGVVVAREQSIDDIRAVRNRTGTLSL